MKSSSSRLNSNRLLLSVAIAAALWVSPAAAQQTRQTFDIPAQSLESALTRFGVDADQQVMFSADLVRGRQAMAVSGQYTPAEALEVLLRGSGLTFEVTSSNVVLIKALPAAPAPPAPVEQPSRQVGPVSSLETVFSTARKREEPLQETPAASTVLSGEALRVEFATDLKDMNFSAPNVNITRGGGFTSYATFFIRGIGDDRPDSTVAPPVAVFVDGVYFPRPNNTALDMFDVESLEILRGPQGTLFGRNTSAGAVQVRTRRPSGEFGTRGSLTVGQYGQLEVRASVDVPIVQDKFDAKVAVLSSQSSGYYRNTLDGKKIGKEDNFAIRPILRFRPNDDLTLTLIGEYIRNDAGQTPAVNGSLPPQTLCSAWGDCGEPRIPRSKFTKDDFNVGSTLGNEATMKNKIWGITGELIWDVGPGEITWVSNYRKTESFFVLEVDPSVVPMWWTPRDEPHKQASSELRFASTAWDKFDFVAGIYGMYQKFSLTHEIFIQSRPTLPRNHQIGYAAQSHKVFSVFAEGNYHLTDALTITAGGRFTWERKSFEAMTPGPFASPNPLLIFDPESWNDFGPKAGIDYKFTDNALAYFTYSKGFRSGGWNAQLSTPTSAGPYNPETVNAFELGLKSDWFDNKLRANVAFFLNKYKGLQRSIVRPVPGVAVGQEVVTENAAAADIKGVELEITAIPVEGLQLSGSLGFLDAKYSDFCADTDGPAMFATAPTSECGTVINVTTPGSTGAGNYLVPVDLTGLPLQRAPKWQLSLGANYEVPVGNAGTLQFNARYTYVSNLNVAIDGSTRGERGKVNLFDASVTYKDIDGRYSVSVFGKNLTNEIYLNNMTHVAAFLTSYGLSEPRRWGIELSWEL